MASAGEHDRAAHLFGAAETLREAVGASVLAFYRADYDRAIDTVRAALGHQAFESCWIEGRTLPRRRRSRTRLVSPASRQGREKSRANRGLATRIFASWNQMSS